MHGVQVPLDGAPRQPGLLPQGGNQADHIHPQPLLAQRRTVRLRRGNAAPSAKGTAAGQVDVPGNLHRNLGQVNDLPGALGPTPRQLAATAGTLFHHVLHPLGGGHAGPGKAVAARLSLRGAFDGAGFPSALGFRPGIRRAPPGLACPCNWAIRFSSPSMVACCPAMIPIRTSRSAMVRSISVSTPVI